jgi:hypothetical protein
MIKAPFEVGQVLINKYDYQIAVVERLDYRDSWYVLLAVGDERHWRFSIYDSESRLYSN